MLFFLNCKTISIQNPKEFYTVLKTLHVKWIRLRAILFNSRENSGVEPHLEGTTYYEMQASPNKTEKFETILW